MKPPNSIQLFSYKDLSSAPPTQAYPGPATLIVSQFVAYIGAPSAIARSAIVFVDVSSPDPGGTIQEFHVDPGGDGQPRFFQSNGRWVFTLPETGPSEWLLAAPTTGSWDFAAFGFALAGVNVNWPVQS